MSERSSEASGRLGDLLEQEAQLDRALHAALLEERQEVQERDKHPDPEELLAYQEAQLPSERREEIAEHLSLCPDCAQMVLDLAAFDDVEHPVETGQAGEDPLPFRPRAGGALLAMRTSTQAGWSAAAVMLLVAVSLVLWLPRGEEPPANVGWMYLTPDSTSRSGGQEQVLELPSGAHHVTLVLGGAWTESYSAYRVEIQEADGKVTWKTEDAARAPDGTVSVLVPVAHMPEDTFEVQLSGRTDGGWEPVEHFSGQYSLPTSDS